MNAILKEENAQIGTIRSELELQKSLFEEEKRKLQDELKAAEINAVSNAAEEKEEDQSEFFREQVDHLKGVMKESSKKNVLEKWVEKFFLWASEFCVSQIVSRFGNGPYRVEIQLEFPPEEVPDGTADKFVIEMAPLDLVSSIHNNANYSQ